MYMLVEVLKSKLHKATVTVRSPLRRFDFIDPQLYRQAGMYTYEKVDIFT